ncbi:hypothetical protein [Mucilaginibacter dorajii]|nr:hypothetical protein [Mucilaginibacter dorajii]MCS3737068.1 hypothetical protein [Mucilaginibacter dorajii]
MKQIFTLLASAFFMLIVFNAKAQDVQDEDIASEKSKSYISLGAGQSRPFGAFKVTDYANPKSGFAKKGLVYSIDGAHYFFKRAALGYTVTYQDQGNLTYDDDVKISQGYTDSYVADGSTVTANKRYRSLNILLGPQYSLVWHAFTFDFRASAGAIKSFATPQIAVDITGVSEQTGEFIQQSSNKFAFAYGGSVGIRLNTGAGWGLFLKGNYVNSAGPKITYTGRTLELGRTVKNQAITEGQAIFGLYKEF